VHVVESEIRGNGRKYNRGSNFVCKIRQMLRFTRYYYWPPQVVLGSEQWLL